MKISIIILLFALMLSAAEIKYGKSHDEIHIGPALSKIVNSDNDYVFAPWFRQSNKDATWVRCGVTFAELITVRDAPKTYRVILVTCIEKANKEKVYTWVYRDDLEDGVLYRKLILRDGDYMLAYVGKDNRTKIISIKSSAQQGDAPEPAAPARW
jgi:hypothetical protein